MGRLQTLFQKYLDNSISEDEYAELWQLVAKEKETGAQLTSALQQLWEQKPHYHLSPAHWHDRLNLLKKNQEPRTRLPFRKIAAAAVVFCAIGIGSYFWIEHSKSENKNKISYTAITHDVAPPTTNKASLSTAGGKIISIDSTNIGSLAKYGITNASKTSDAKLVFTANKTAPLEYHTLQVSKGSKPMQIQLADGSRIWLNTASSITFPSVFPGNQRTVSLTGEAYFEVAHNAAKPFVVKVDEMTVKVLGTHFNINGYNDEDNIKTTLLEGKVKVENGGIQKVLRPGEQALLNSSGSLNVISHPDVDEVLAWREGNFLFENCSIYEVMKQLQRWYDVDVEYQTQNIQQHFEGVLSRNVALTKVLEMLERSSTLTFTINNKKIIVSQT